MGLLEVAKRIIDNDGYCIDIPCMECPFYNKPYTRGCIEIIKASDGNFKQAKKAWLIEYVRKLETSEIKPYVEYLEV